MSDELFEVAFSGEILEGAELAQVKAKVGAMFKADEAKLAHLFSGKRVVIKKNIDEATAKKYQAALTKAGARCELKSLAEPSAEPQAEPVDEPVSQESASEVQAQNTVAAPAAASSVYAGDIPAAPQTSPLGISANDISDLTVSVAPVGSDMQDEIREVAEPELDISGIDMAPAGSDLGEEKKDDVPPPPDTSGLSLADS